MRKIIRFLDVRKLTRYIGIIQDPISQEARKFCSNKSISSLDSSLRGCKWGHSCVPTSPSRTFTNVISSGFINPNVANF